MNALRRVVALTGLTVTVVIGGGVAASAAFSDVVAVKQTIETGTLAAPTWVNATVTVCHPVHYFTVTVDWPASATTRGVTGYRVVAHLNDGRDLLLGQTDAGTLSLSTRVNDRSALSFAPQVTVTTLSSYGWTGESAPSAVLSCPR